MKEAAQVVGAGTLLDPDGAHDRLRPPLRDLQAGQPDLPRPRPAAAPAGQTRGGRSRSSSPARPTRPTTRARKCSRASTSSPATPSSRAAWRSSRTTTCTWPICWCRAWTSGSTCRACRSRPAGTSGMKAGAQRHPAAQHARRLVAGGLRWTERLGHLARPARARTPMRPTRTDFYRLLEEQVIPLYYTRNAAGRPARLGREDASRAAARGLADSPPGACSRTTCRNTTPQQSVASRPATTRPRLEAWQDGHRPRARLAPADARPAARPPDGEPVSVVHVTAEYFPLRPHRRPRRGRERPGPASSRPPASNVLGDPAALPHRPRRRARPRAGRAAVPGADRRPDRGGARLPRGRRPRPGPQVFFIEHLGVLQPARASTARTPSTIPTTRAASPSSRSPRSPPCPGW